MRHAESESQALRRGALVGQGAPLGPSVGPSVRAMGRSPLGRSVSVKPWSVAAWDSGWVHVVGRSGCLGRRRPLTAEMLAVPTKVVVSVS